MNQPIRIGVLGGSGLYQMTDWQDVETLTMTTPWGDPSDSYRVGTMSGVRVVFLARHGQGHRLLPSEVPYRANIYGFKQLGVRYIISASAVGSLSEVIAPLDIVVPDQFIDRTHQRQATFLGGGAVAHISFADPVCPALAEVLVAAARAQNFPGPSVHAQGTYVCMEGPAFSTRAESELYRRWGAQVIGMTNLTEAKLAREAEIAYATLALVTDYDCWNRDREAVSVEMVIENLNRNAVHAQQVIATAVAQLAAQPPTSIAHTALKTGLLTPPAAIPPETRHRLEALLAGWA